MYRVGFSLERIDGRAWKTQLFEVIGAGAVRVRVKTKGRSNSEAGQREWLAARSPEPFMVIITTEFGDGECKGRKTSSILVATDEKGHMGVSLRVFVKGTGDKADALYPLLRAEDPVA
jgi:hypothetical protein